MKAYKTYYFLMIFDTLLLSAGDQVIRQILSKNIGKLYPGELSNECLSLKPI